jgi:hypothetical protein
MIKIIHDIQTGEITELKMTKDEIAILQATETQAQADRVAAEAEAAAKESARAALLDKLGITADEAKLLLG